jgi:hypothetical protein
MVVALVCGGANMTMPWPYCSDRMVVMAVSALLRQRDVPSRDGNSAWWLHQRHFFGVVNMLRFTRMVAKLLHLDNGHVEIKQRY